MPAVPLPDFRSLVNNQYLYEDHDITAILNALVDDVVSNDPAAFIKPVYVLGAASSPETLQTILEEEKAQNQIARMLLIPYNLSPDFSKKHTGHWVGILLEIENNTAVRALYIDSLQANNAAQTAQPEPALSAVCLVAYPGAILKGVRYMCQEDATSCGPFMIENLLLAAKNITQLPANPGSIAYRTEHLKVLFDRRPDYYPGFVARQAANGTTITPMLRFMRDIPSLLSNASLRMDRPADVPTTAQDDLLLTLLILSRLSDRNLAKRYNTLTTSDQIKFFRQNFKIGRTEAGKVILISKRPARRAHSFNSIEQEDMLQVMNQEMRTELWKLPQYRSMDLQVFGGFSLLILGIGIGDSLGLFSVGAAGAAQRAALVSAVAATNSARAASTSALATAGTQATAAFETGLGAVLAGEELGTVVPATLSQIAQSYGTAISTAVTTSTQANLATLQLLGKATVGACTNLWVMGPAITFGLVQYAKSSAAHRVTDAIQQSLRLYQEGSLYNDQAKFVEAEKILWIALNPFHGLTWPFVSNDQYAYAYLLLGVLHVKLGKNTAYDLLNIAFTNAVETKIKQQSLLWMTYALAKDSPCKDIKQNGRIINAQERTNLERENAGLLQITYPNIIKECDSLTKQAIGFVLNMLVNGNASVDDINAFISSGDLAYLRVLDHRGKLGAIIFIFLQAICLQEKGLDPKHKFQECLALIADNTAGRALDLENPQDIVIHEIREYLRRNVNLHMPEDHVALVIDADAAPR